LAFKTNLNKTKIILVIYLQCKFDCKVRFKGGRYGQWQIRFCSVFGVLPIVVFFGGGQGGYCHKCFSTAYAYASEFSAQDSVTNLPLSSYRAYCRDLF